MMTCDEKMIKGHNCKETNLWVDLVLFDFFNKETGETVQYHCKNRSLDMDIITVNDKREKKVEPTMGKYVKAHMKERKILDILCPFCQESLTVRKYVPE